MNALSYFEILQNFYNAQDILKVSFFYDVKFQGSSRHWGDPGRQHRGQFAKPCDENVICKIWEHQTSLETISTISSSPHNFHFHNQVSTYTGVSQLEWRELKTGHLALPTFELRAAMVDDIIYLTGGSDVYGELLTSILRWDPSTESL